MIRKLSVLIVLLCVVTIIYSCTRGPEKAVLGKWQNTKDSKEKLQFYKNGVLEIYDGDDVKGRIRYEFVTDNQVKIISGSVVELVQISRDKDNLNWYINDPEKQTVYKKIK